MIEKYKDVDAIVAIEGKEYALCKRGPRRKYPHMIDIATGEIPDGEQRSLLKSYLQSNGVNVEPWDNRVTHWYVRQAIKVAHGNDGEK